jgi:hypothetical protein
LRGRGFGRDRSSLFLDPLAIGLLEPAASGHASENLFGVDLADLLRRDTLLFRALSVDLASFSVDGLDRGLLDPDDLTFSLARVEKIRRAYLEPVNLADAEAVATHFST